LGTAAAAAAAKKAAATKKAIGWPPELDVWPYQIKSQSLMFGHIKLKDL